MLLFHMHFFETDLTNHMHWQRKLYESISISIYDIIERYCI